MSSSLNRLAQRIHAVEAELAAARTPQLAHSSIELEDGTELGVTEGLQTAVVADQKADTATELASGAASAAEVAQAAADAAAAEALLAAEAGAAAQVAADDAAAAAASVQTEVEGIPAQIAAAKSEAITTAAGTAQQKADAAKQAAIDAAALTAQAKADAAKAAALTEAAVTAQEKADAAAATAKAEALTAAASDAQTKADLAKAAAINAAATDAKNKADAAQAAAISAAATDAQTKATKAKDDAISAAALTAQQKADAAKQAAIDAAALDAKAKADAAQSAATTAAAADAQSKANAAKAAAEAAAKTYSDTVASGAKSEAIAAAAADAKSKADAAELAAKTAAAADAKAKADAAQAAAIAAAAQTAQDKADLAKAAAINAAATDATTKANNAQAAAIAAAATTAQQKADAAKADAIAQSAIDIQVAKSLNYGYRYAYDITVNGDHATYYPVVIYGGDQNVKRDILVKRSYSEQHPPEWNTPTHGGGLTLKIKTNFGGWGGANYSWEIHELEQMYNDTFAGAGNTAFQMGFYVLLRGGGAIYHLYSDQPIEIAEHATTGEPSPKVYYDSTPIVTKANTNYSYVPGPPTTVVRSEEIRTRKFIALAQGTDALTQGWKATGKTTIDGGKIETDSITAAQIAVDAITANELKAGAVTAAKIAANAVSAASIQSNVISARHLVIADGSNMAEINETLTGSVTYGGWKHVLETDANGVVWSKRDNIDINQYLMFRNQVGPIPFKTGDRIRVTFEAYSNVLAAPSLYYWTYGGSAGMGNIPAVSGFPTQITTTPQTFAYEGVIGANMNGTQATYLIGLQSLQGKDVRVRNVRAYVMNAGELIVDGTITANKVAVNAITADKIEAGAVVAGKLAVDAVLANNIKAGEITVDKLATNVLTIGNIPSLQNTLDGKETPSGAQAKADAAKTAAITAAAADAKNKADAAELAAKTAAASDAKAKADAAEAAAKAAAALDAKAKADAAEGAAKTAAAADAKAKADAAQAAAITAAASDAKAKADAAEAAAKTAAAADAKSKADAAQAAAQSYTDTNYGETKSLVGGWRVTGQTTIAGGKIATDSITSAQIAAGAVTADEIQAGAVIAGKLAADAVAANNVQAGAIVAGKIAADGVLATNIVSDAILSRHVKAGEIEAFHIKTGSITAASGVIGSIDATKITVNKITAAQMEVGTITAASGIIGSLSASTLLTGELRAGTRVIAGPETGSHAEMSDTGFRSFTTDAEGTVRESVRMGTDTNDLFAVTDASGQTVGSISETGFASFAGASINATSFDADGNPTGGLEIYGQDFLTYIDALPKGIIASAISDNVSILNVTNRMGIAEVTFKARPDRNYRISASGGWVSPSVAGTRTVISIRATADGSTPKVTTTPPRAVSSVVHPTTNGQTMPPINVYGTWTTSGEATIRALLCIEGQYGTTRLETNRLSDIYHNPIRIIVEDIGLDTPDTWIANDGGATTTVTPKQKFTKTYQSNGWATYRSKNGSLRGSSSSVGDTSSKVYQGYSSSTSYNGDQQGLWTFPSITGDVGSGTIDKVEVYLYAAHWYYNSGGTAFIRTHGYANGGWPTGSTPSMTAAVTSSSWPKPGGRWVTLPSSTYASWKSGAIKGVGVGPAGGTNLLYYGYFNAAAQLRVTYTK